MWQVRNAAADGLFLVRPVDALRRINWATAPRALKPAVRDIRRHVGVDGCAASGFTT
jgi:hypothetical protein